MANEQLRNNMRIYHRYLGFFLVGIMGMYAISGITLIFRDTNFLKSDRQNERQLRPGLTAEEVGKEIRMRDLKVEKEEGDVLFFAQGNYNKSTGVAQYVTKELPRFVDKVQHIHKADTKSPLYFLNIFFGLSLLFFVISSFWMFLPGAPTFKKGMYFVLGGAALTLLMILF
jgi:hypothetical protein